MSTKQAPSNSPYPLRGEDWGEGETSTARLVGQTVESATARLTAALALPRTEARLEAHLLAARALGQNRAWLIAHDRDILTPAQAATVEALIARREIGEPVAYILGEKEFYGRMFKVSPDVLIPRPETELLVEAALARIPLDQPTRALDLGTGSGCIAITIALERPRSTVVAVDQSIQCIAMARANAVALGAQNCTFTQSDWFTCLAGKTFDIIVANPPYIAPLDTHLDTGDLRFEPRTALSSAEDGLADIRVIIEQAIHHLPSSGWLLVEHGYDQADAAIALFERFGFHTVETLADLAGQPRITLGRTC